MLRKGSSGFIEEWSVAPDEFFLSPTDYRLPATDYCFLLPDAPFLVQSTRACSSAGDNESDKTLCPRKSSLMILHHSSLPRFITDCLSLCPRRKLLSEEYRW